MKLLHFLWNRIYTTWCVFWFVLPFVLLYPFLRILSARESTRPMAHSLHRLWAKQAMFFFLLPINIKGLNRLDAENNRYVFCPNHSSYIDILLLLRSVPGYLNFVGKSSLAKTPLWGKIYERLYICVDRKSRVSRARSFIEAKNSLANGRNMVIFPEGKIEYEHSGRQLLPFHNGAFRLAIEQQVPIVPVSMPYNQLFLPEMHGKLRVRWHPIKAVFHEPISTKGMTLEDTETLKETVYNIIQNELNRHPHHANRYKHTTRTGALSTT